ncbi:glycoside hydrolase family 88/105 protein [Hymenobacter crusticola]|uniref:Glycosyl hydrolase n=1 Tax=Hymenobacter crusticola TaxID=1770526 RepID=A0A243W694_9BACT|nr:glycoside hydrolase family 88 protein [Hymenobacter crusticola]OUJ69786.1 glycosyl hydrolase [Hymenobacter crusticola]
MKKLLAVFVLVLNVQLLAAQTTEAVVRKVADQVLKETVLGFQGVENKQFYASAAAVPQGVPVKYASPYTGWHYTHGVLNLAMIDLGRLLGEQKYVDYAARHVAFGFDNYRVFEQRFQSGVKHYAYPYGEFFTMDELDDFGAMSASILEVYQQVKRPAYKAYLEKAAKHLTEERLRLLDRTFVRAFPYQNTLWADDLYMSVPFLVRMGKFTGQQKYLEEAVTQVLNFTKYLWDEKEELYWHTWYSDLKRNGVAHWGRCNGWVLLAQVHLLDYLPANHPQRARLIQLLERQILGIAKYQSAEGLWHQVLDKPDSYLESSCSAMFVYGVAHAVNHGWIDPRYASIATSGWEGLKKYKIDEQGRLKDICVGTGIQDNLVFYYTRPVGINEKHGTGPLLDAGVEILKLEKRGK